MPIAGSDSLLRLAALPGKRRRLRHERGQLLREEGLLQDLWSILYSARHYDPDPLRLAPLIRYLYRGLDVRLVHIKVDADCARDRIVGRPDGKSRFDAMTEAELRGRLRETASLAPAIAAAAVAAGLTVETLDGLAPLAVNADRLRTIVQQAGAPGGQTA
jgi:hypothetical protein